MDDFKNIKQITVLLESGEEYIYRNKGLERFKKEMRSMLYKKTSKIIEEDFSTDNKPLNTVYVPNGGYKTTSFNYEASPLTPQELASQMRKDAEQKGLQF